MDPGAVLDLGHANHQKLVGGKALALGKMIRAGVRVPPGFVVTTAVFNNMTPALEALIKDSFAKLGSGLVAVRSSAPSEDSMGDAWAGQLDTYLNIDKAGLIKHIELVWGSLKSERARSYASQKSLTAQPMAVIVQKMIESEVSGIAFSAHPITSNKEQLVIEAAWGLGEAVVSGEITPDTYVVSKSPYKVIEKRLQPQTKKLVRGPDGLTTWQQIASKGDRAKLNDRQIRALVLEVIRLEELFGYPVDVEWGWLGGQLYVLQCRPITTLM